MQMRGVKRASGDGGEETVRKSMASTSLYYTIEHQCEKGNSKDCFWFHQHPGRKNVFKVKCCRERQRERERKAPPIWKQMEPMVQKSGGGSLPSCQLVASLNNAAEHCQHWAELSSFLPHSLWGLSPCDPFLPLSSPEWYQPHCKSFR